MEKWSFQRIRELMTPIALRGMAGNEIGRARISMMARSMSSKTRPDTLVQDRTPALPFSLATHGGSIHWVKRFRPSTAAVSMSPTGSRFSPESAPRPLYGAFFVKETARAAKLSFGGFLVRSQTSFLRPRPAHR
jgi:hypothetical protein